MEATIEQWGDSLALRIPKALAKQTSVKKGSTVNLTVENGQMVMTPIPQEPVTLKSLLAKVTPENIHPETDWGPPVGKELW